MGENIHELCVSSTTYESFIWGMLLKAWLGPHFVIQWFLSLMSGEVIKNPSLIWLQEPWVKLEFNYFHRCITTSCSSHSRLQQSRITVCTSNTGSYNHFVKPIENTCHCKKKLVVLATSWAGFHVGQWGAFTPTLLESRPPLGTCEHCMRCENKTSDAPSSPPFDNFSKWIPG